MTTPAANLFLLEGSLAHAEIENAGIRIDKAYLDDALKRTAAQIREYETQLTADPVFRTWRRRYGDRASLWSPEQLAGVVFGELGYKSRFKTAKTGRDSADESAFAGIDLPFLTTYFAGAKIRKARGTYLVGIQREMVEHDAGQWFVHPSYHLNTARTYRPSCIAVGSLVEVVRDVSANPRGIPIEDVRVGDYVYCYDADRHLCLRRVTWAGKTGRRRVVRLHWKGGRGKSGHLDLTPEHLVRVASGEYVKAGELSSGDYRAPGTNKHKARISVLAMGRRGHRIYETGRQSHYLDHRFVYSQLIGELADNEVIHHRNHNHLDNRLENLQKMESLAEHSRLHAPTSFTLEGIKKGCKERQRRHRLYGDRWPSGSENGRWIELSKFTILRMLSAVAGRITAIRDRGLMDFQTFSDKATAVGIDPKIVKLRYDKDGKYITRGRMVAVGGRHHAMKVFGTSFYSIKKMYTQRGFATQRRWANQCGPFIPHNHTISSVEWLEGEVDVYDLQVEGEHNFIANEICVHNCTEPNFANQPNRNPVMAEMVRRCYIPRPGHRLIEIDYSQAEVRIGSCYHRDPTLIDYIKNPASDMHRDMARKIFFLSDDEIKQSKPVRNLVKGDFVFAEFYGSYWPHCAENLWNGSAGQTIGKNGPPIHSRLAERGITELGSCDPKSEPAADSFAAHVKKIETWMWEKRFPGYRQWKRDWFAEYQRNGGFMMLTGFAVNGFLGRNDATNYPIQGSSYHCMLLANTRIIRRLRKNRMRSRVVGEVYDCLVGDVHPDETDDFINICHDEMVRGVMDTWDWIIVNLEAEAEVCEPDASWFEKRVWINRDGVWQLKA